ncbi:MAG: glutaminyl-peptide cyclotransferase [Cyclobacteriaceae bacterium]
MSKTSIAIIAILLLSCGEKETKERPATPRIKKQTKIVSPKQNERLSLGDAVSFEFASGDVEIDSIQLEENSSSQTFSASKFEIKLTATKVGSQRIKSTVYFAGKKETHYSKVVVFPTEEPEEYTYEIVNTYPHDPSDYTQGLLVDGGFMYESTGQNGNSALKKKDIESGKTLEQINLSDDFFGEGLALLDDKFYQLTYTSQACFVYDRSFEKINTFTYEDQQGWGLTEFEGNLLMTNSSQKLLVRSPDNFAVLEEYEVYNNEGKVESINELEIIDGMIYANVYQEDYIVVIDPDTGTVVRKIDMSGLLSAAELEGVDVLNGIAYDQQNDRIFVTGKLWPKLFEVKFTPKKPVQ